MPKWLPNALTAARLVAIVPFTILLARSDDAISTGAALLFAAAAWTDFLDGYLARHANAQSRFGRIADPLADRLLIDLALVLLVYHQRLEWWLAAPVLLRDALLAAVFRARHEATEVQVNHARQGRHGRHHAVAVPADADRRRTGRRCSTCLGLVLSVAAGARYLKQEGGLESKPS